MLISAIIILNAETNYLLDCVLFSDDIFNYSNSMVLSEIRLKTHEFFQFFFLCAAKSR